MGTPALPPAPPAPPVPATPAVLARRGQAWRVVWLALLISVCALATIGFVSFLGWNLGPLALAVGIAGAILPVPVLIACFLWLDRYEPSPMWIIVSSFLWGAGVATSGSYVLNNLGSVLFDRLGLPDSLVAVLVAPIVEESFKAAFPLLLFVFYRRAFTGITDGIVYCGLCATGFAMVENILYLGGISFADNATNSLAAGVLATLVTFVARVPLTGFAHPLFTSMTGIAVGFAARSRQRSVQLLALLVGLLAAMTLHALFNLTALLSAVSPYVALYGYFGFMMPIFFGMLGFVLWIRSREGRLAERVLGVYVGAGWISPPELVALGSMGRRLSARRWAGRVAGDAGRTAMHGFQLAATRLALLRDGLNRGLYRGEADIAAAQGDERRLLTEMTSLRKIFVGRDPLTPRAWWTGSAYQIQFPDGVVRVVAAPALPVVPVPVPLPVPLPTYPR